jgi:hypothetical protein
MLAAQVVMLKLDPAGQAAMTGRSCRVHTVPVRETWKLIEVEHELYA